MVKEITNAIAAASGSSRGTDEAVRAIQDELSRARPGPMIRVTAPPKVVEKAGQDLRAQLP